MDFIRGDGPGHPHNEPPTESEATGNGWVVCTPVFKGADIVKRRLTPADWDWYERLGGTARIVPQAVLDEKDWELGVTVVADPPPVVVPPVVVPPIVLPPLPPLVGREPWLTNPNLFWNRRLPSTTPANPYSAAYRDRIVSYLRTIGAYNVQESIWPNTNGFTCPIYIADASTPKVYVDFGGGWHGSTRADGTRIIDGAVTAYMNRNGGIRIPRGAKVSPAADHELAVYDSVDNVLYEFWCCLEPGQTVTDIEGGIGPSRQVNPTNNYQTMTAGVMENFATTANGRFIDTPGYANKLWGTAATGLTYTGGRITPYDMDSGVIAHAIDISLPFNLRCNESSWPAWRNDYGSLNNTQGPPEGLRFRLPAAFDHTTLANPFARMVARCLRDYGAVINDNSGKASIRFDSSIGFTSMGKQDPWPSLFAAKEISYASAGSGAEAMYQSQRNVRVALAQIPWEQISFLPSGYGRNPGELLP